MLVALERLEIPPGQKLLLRHVTWDEFETIVEELGEHRGSRLAYAHGVLEIMTPLPGHEWDKEILSDLIKALLEELERDFGCLGSTTFKQPMEHGLEPDQCFYIRHEVAIRGKERIDLTVDPPPDLALEVGSDLAHAHGDLCRLTCAGTLALCARAVAHRCTARQCLCRSVREPDFSRVPTAHGDS